MVVLKGRRQLPARGGRCTAPAATPFAEVTSYFRAPLLALRTLKSDAVVGLRPGLAEELDGIDPRWRINGRRAVIQGNGR